VREREQGFSLIELMVAMVVTLIISGAVFQLVTAGNSAFRREPAMADRQQNIRMALDLISQDVYKAGYGVPDFAQVFTPALDGTGPAGSGGENSDHLEFVVAEECAHLEVCSVSGMELFTLDRPGSCFVPPATVIASCDTGTNCPAYDVYWADAKGGAAPCGKGHIDRTNQRSTLTPPGGHKNITPQWLLVGSIVRYRINPDADGVPNLERSAFGGAKDATGNDSWQVLARGVEDLQVQYQIAAGWRDDPGTTSNIDTLVRRVHVRLSARSTEANLAGQTTSAGAGNAVRGELEIAVAPRAAVTVLGMSSGQL